MYSQVYTAERSLLRALHPCGPCDTIPYDTRYNGRVNMPHGTKKTENVKNF